MTRSPESFETRALLVVVPCVLAWGALAFGSNYPWAYTPLAFAAALTGAAMLVAGRAPLPWGLVAAFGAVALAVLLQLAPVPSGWLRALSPASDSVLREYRLGYDRGAWGRISIAADATWRSLALFAAFVLLVLGVARFLTHSRTRRMAGGIVILGVLLSIVGLVQRGVSTGLVYGFWEPQMGGTPFGPFVNKNHFAGWMLMAAPLAAGTFGALVSRGMRGIRPHWRDRLLWLSSPEANQAILLGAATLLMALALVMTMSRSGMLSLAAAVLVMGVVAIARQRTATRRAAHVGYLALVVWCVVMWVGADVIAARFDAPNTVTLSGRVPIWRDTLSIAQDFWLTGTGLNTYGVATLFYQTSLPEYHLREAHSDYLQLAAEGGVLLAVPVLIAVATFAREVRRRFREDQGSIYWVRIGAVTGILAIALQSTVEFSLQMPGNAALFAVLCGIALTTNPRKS